MDIEEKVLKLIKTRKKGILQSELWKKVEIDRRKCSRIVDKLEKDGKITREEESNKGTRTYRISFIQKKEEKLKNFKSLLVRDMFAPCTGCSLECVPEACASLSEWVYYLTEEK